jgi:hypothetical protein
LTFYDKGLRGSNTMQAFAVLGKNCPKRLRCFYRLPSYAKAILNSEFKILN